MDYYELLGIDTDSSQEEIKKAYFNKVRQYSPEKYPEIFREIREAYDTLRDEISRKAYERRKNVPDDKRIISVRECFESGKFKAAVKILKDILKSNPESEEAKVMLAKSYEEIVEFGNASKVYGQLSIDYPDNQEYAISYASALYNRNHKKKAYTQFEKAVAMNVESPDAWEKWVDTVSDDEILASKVINMAESISKDIFKKHYNIYAILWLNITRNKRCFDYAEVINNYDLFKKYIEFYRMDSFPDEDRILLLLECLREILEYENGLDEGLMDEGIALLEKTIDSGSKYKLNYILVSYEFKKLNMIGKELDDVLHDFTVMAAGIGKSSGIQEEFEMVMVKTYIISKFSKLKGSIIYLKENSPKIYAFNADFYEQIMDPKNRKAMEKQMKKLVSIDGMDADLSQVFDGEFTVETPFKKEQQKVGRNDPCICGSGKKYKRCCGA